MRIPFLAPTLLIAAISAQAAPPVALGASILVISHDPHISGEICVAPDGSKIAQPPLIHDLTLAQVKKYDCGTLKHPRSADQKPLPGTRIPTLREVFELVRKSTSPAAKTVRFNIETKIFAEHPEYTSGPQEFMKLVLAEFRQSGFLPRIVLQSFDPRTLRIARKEEPKLHAAGYARGLAQARGDESGRDHHGRSGGAEKFFGALVFKE